MTQLPDRDRSRLTPDDLAAIGKAISETAALWRDPTHGRTVRPFDTIERDTLYRVGAHAIGCTLDDLRPSEVARITDAIGAADVDR